MVILLFWLNNGRIPLGSFLLVLPCADHIPDILFLAGYGKILQGSLTFHIPPFSIQNENIIIVVVQIVQKMAYSSFFAKQRSHSIK